MPYTYNSFTESLDYYSSPTFISGTITAHDGLTGLLNDDHTQYHTDTRGDIRYYTKTTLNAGQLDTRYYTETEVDTISGSLSVSQTTLSGNLQTNIDGKSDTGHTHDGRYYTETELNAGQLDTRYYTQSEVDTISGALLGAEENYGEAYIYNNATVTVIETADTPIALRQISAGLVHNFIFDAGSTGAITAYADYSGTVSGTVKATNVGHGLVTENFITIRGTTNYNGVFEITRINDNEFYFTDTWVDDNGASDWDQGASLTYIGAITTVHCMAWQMSTFPASACTITFMMYKNTIPLTKSTAERKFVINDLGSTSSSCVCTLTAGDVIWLTAQSDGTADITNKHGEFNLRRL